MDLSLSKHLIIFPVQSSMLYNFQHSLTQQSPSHFHARYCRRCGKLFSVVMNSMMRVVWVRWWCHTDSHLGYVDGWDRSCGCPGALSRIRRILSARFLEFRYTFWSSFHWCGLHHHSTIENDFCASNSSCTHNAFAILSENGLQWLTAEIFTLGGALALMFLLICLHFSWWKRSWICLHHNGIWQQQCLFFCAAYPAPPLSLKETSLSFYFYPETLHQHVHHPLQAYLKHKGNREV